MFLAHCSWDMHLPIGSWIAIVNKKEQEQRDWWRRERSWKGTCSRKLVMELPEQSRSNVRATKRWDVLDVWLAWITNKLNHGEGTSPCLVFHPMVVIISLQTLNVSLRWDVKLFQPRRQSCRDFFQLNRVQRGPTLRLLELLWAHFLFSSHQKH